MTERRQRWAGLALFAVSAAVLLGLGAVAPAGGPPGLGAATLVVTAVLLAGHLSRPAVLAPAMVRVQPVGRAAGTRPPSPIRSCDPDAAGRVRPRAPGERRHRAPGPS